MIAKGLLIVSDVSVDVLDVSEVLIYLVFFYFLLMNDT